MYINLVLEELLSFPLMGGFTSDAHWSRKLQLKVKTEKRYTYYAQYQHAMP